MGKHRWLVCDNGEFKEYPTGRSVCKKYNCSSVSLYARLKCKNGSPKSPIFGTSIKVFRIPGEFGDEYDKEKLLADDLCDKCRIPISEKDVICENCDNN